MRVAVVCKCTPEIRTPFCGKPGCEWPGRETDEVQLLAVRLRRNGALANLMSAVVAGVKPGSLVPGGVATLPELADQVVVIDLDHCLVDRPEQSGLSEAQTVAVLELLVLQLRGPDSRCATRELSLAVTELESAINWLKRSNEVYLRGLGK